MTIKLTRYERGVNKIDIDTLVTVLTILNVNIRDFFDQLADSDMSINHIQPITDTQDNYLNTKLALEAETEGFNF